METEKHQSSNELKLLGRLEEVSYLAEKVRHLLDGLIEDYFCRYDSDEPWDKFAILAEYRRHASYAFIARECVFEILENSQ